MNQPVTIEDQYRHTVRTAHTADPTGTRQRLAMCSEHTNTMTCTLDELVDVAVTNDLADGLDNAVFRDEHDILFPSSHHTATVC